METIENTIKRDLRAYSDNALRAIAARAYRLGWVCSLAAIRAEFQARAHGVVTL